MVFEVYVWVAVGFVLGLGTAVVLADQFRKWVLIQLDEATKAYEKADKQMDRVLAAWDRLHEKMDEFEKQRAEYEVTDRDR